MQDEEIFQTILEWWAQFSQWGQRKRQKNNITLGQKFPWESCCTTHLPFLSSNSNILKAFPKIFPTELKTTNSRRKQMRQEKAEEEERRKSGKIWKLKLLSGHAQTWQKLIFCIWYEGWEVYNFLTAFLVFNN